jgi:hypothetical protein
MRLAVFCTLPIWSVSEWNSVRQGLALRGIGADIFDAFVVAGTDGAEVSIKLRRLRIAGGASA